MKSFLGTILGLLVSLAAVAAADGEPQPEASGTSTRVEPSGIPNRTAPIPFRDGIEGTITIDEPLPPPDDRPQFYVGLGANLTHHTGYLPGHGLAIEKWAPGGKVFMGRRLCDWLGLEGAFHYLGEAQAGEGTPLSYTERTSSLSAALLVYAPPASRWGILEAFPTRLFGRVGGAFKLIDHQNALGSFQESGVTYVLGFGLETNLTSSVFFRFDYEYLSKILGGTDRAVNVQHTPISIGLGVRF